MSEGPAGTQTPESKRKLLQQLLLNRNASTRKELEPAPAGASSVLTSAQQRLWYAHQLRPSGENQITLLAELEGPFDPAAFESALRSVAQHNPVLRTLWRPEEGRLIPVEHPAEAISLRFEDADDPASLCEAEAQRVLDFTSELPLRVTVVRTGPARHTLVITQSNMAGDLLSLRALLEQVTAIYRGGKPVAPTLTYADYAHAEAQWLKSPDCQTQLDYWRRKLEGLTPLDLPLDFPRLPTPTFARGVVPITFPQPLVEALRLLSREKNATLFMTLAAGLHALLHRVTGQPDVSFNVLVSGRRRAGTEKMIGRFDNAVVLRAELGEDLSFAQHLDRTRAALLEAMARQDVPIDQVVRAVRPDRTGDRNPLGQVVFNLQPALETPLELPGVSARAQVLDRGGTLNELEFWIFETAAGALEGHLFYRSELFERETAERLSRAWVQLLADAAAQPQRNVDALELLDDRERRRLLVDWNATADESEDPPNVAAMFEAAVARDPGRVALKSADLAWTYGELNARANRLAHTLVEAGVGPELPVAVVCQRGPGLLTAMLAIWKAGGVYVPLDGAAPPARLTELLRRSGARVTLCDDALASKLPPDAINVSRADAGDPENLPSRAGPDSLACLLFTSGTTGEPKAVMLHHRGLVNHQLAQVKVFGLTAEDVVAQTAGPTFVVHLWQHLTALTLGARVEFVPDEVTRDPRAWPGYLDGAGVTVAQAVPSFLRSVLEELGRSPSVGPFLSRLRYVSPTGEPLPSDLCQRWFARYAHVPLMNAYGMTECSDDVTHAVLRETPRSAIAPAGRPARNVRVYVLDPRGQPVPPGVVGELFIGGAGVSRGYLGDAALTAAKFVPDPFANSGRARMYRSGDLARWRCDGTLEVLGRRDDQVKLLGVRIELGEIEAALRAHPAVKDAVVVPREERPGERRLVGYVVMSGADQHGAQQILRRFLALTLPEVMIPYTFVFLDALPRNRNGKVDRRALPAPSSATTAGEYVAPRNPVEQTLAQIWGGLLNLERVGVHDDFFALGGDSLMAARVLGKARTAGLKFGLQQFLKHRTIAELAATLSG